MSSSIGTLTPITKFSSSDEFESPGSPSVAPDSLRSHNDAAGEVGDVSSHPLSSTGDTTPIQTMSMQSGSGFQVANSIIERCNSKILAKRRESTAKQIWGFCKRFGATYSGQDE